MRFEARRIRFGPAPPQEDEEENAGLPRPQLVKLRARRAEAIREAADVLAILPQETGESLHCLCTHRLDLADVLDHLLDRLGTCEKMAVATLGYNAKNVRQIIAWLDRGRVRELALLASLFYRSHNGAAWELTQEEFHRRGQLCACAASHAKVCTLEFASGQKFVIEGSSNLCGSGSSREQIAIIRDDDLHDWHRRWILEMVQAYEGKPSEQRAG